jgi:hypothetical protein
MNLIHGATAIGVFLALAACNRDRATEKSDRMRGNEPGTSTVTGANVPSISNETAISRITEARCGREAACGGIGKDKHYISRDVCTEGVHASTKNDLNSQACPGGIEQMQLDKCVATIKAESCNNPIDAIERLAACRISDLCLKASPMYPGHMP